MNLFYFYKAEVVATLLSPVAVAVNNTPALDGSITQYTVNGLLLIAITFLLAKWQLCEKKREQERNEAKLERKEADKLHAERLDAKDKIHQEKIDDMRKKLITVVEKK